MTFQAVQPRLVLASASASRRALLSAAGLRFDTMPAAVNEAVIKQTARAEGFSAGETALRLATAKAARVAEQAPAALVIGCDQLLVCGTAWFDKPADLSEAARHLRALSGQTHRLATATVVWRGGQQVWQHLAWPELTMRPLSDGFIASYLALEGPAVLSSVGAYRLEGPGVQLFSRIDGEHSAILGLPLLPLLEFLRNEEVLQS